MDGGLNPRLSAARRKLAQILPRTLGGQSAELIDPCQRRKPPEAVAKGQRLQGSIAR